MNFKNHKNHKKIFFTTFICLPIIFASCGNYTLPSSVSIKTDADLGLYLGKVDYDFSETLDVNSLTEQMTQNLGDDVQVYQYLDDESAESKENALTYLVHYPVAKTELDVGSYLDDLNFDSLLGSSSTSGMNFSQTISVPQVSSSLEKEISINLVEKMSNYTSKQFGDSFTIPLTENSQTDSIKSLLSGHDSINFESIATVYYSSGSSIDIVFDKTDSNSCADDFSFKVTGKILDSSTNSELSKSDETEVKNGGTVSIPIGKDKLSSGLPQKFKFTMEVSLSGTATTAHSYSVSMGISSSSKVEKIANITASSQDLREGKIAGFDADEDFGKISIDDTEVSLESAYGYFESATIKSGHIAFYNEVCSPLDNSNMSKTYEISISGCGLNLTQSDFSEDSSKNGRFVNKYLDLAGKTLDFSSLSDSSQAKLTFSGNISYEVQNATIDLESLSGSEELTIKFIAESVLDSLYNVKVDFTSDKYSSITTSYSLPTTESEGTALPEQLISYVKTISFGKESSSGETKTYYKSDESGNQTSTLAQGFGVVCDVKNTLPVEIPITLKSQIFGLDVSDKIISNSDTKTYTWVSYPTVDLSNYTNDEKHYVDLSFALGLTDDKYLTLGSDSNPFELGKDYEISLEYKEMKMDWDSVTLRSGSVSIPAEQSIDGLSLDSVLSDLEIDSSTLQNVKISQFDIYLYVQKPSSTSSSALNALINKIGFNGKAYISYSDSNSASQTKYIIGSESSGETLTFCDEITWPSSGTNISIASGSSTYDFAQNFLDSSKYSFKTDLASIVNEQPESLNFVSNLALTSSDNSDLVVYKAMIDGLSSGDKASVGIDMLAYIPFELSLTGDISVDVMELTDKTWNTDNASKDLLNRSDDWTPASWAEYSKAVEKLAVYYNVSNTVFSDFNLSGKISDSASNLNKTINLYTNSSNVLELTGTEINNVLTNKPFHPNVLLTLEGGTSESPKTLKIKRSVLDSNSSNKVSADVTMRLDVDGNSTISINDLVSAFGGN